MELPKNSFDIVSLDLTYKCNYRCLHCYNSSGTHNYAVELSDNQISSVVNSYIALRPRSFCICGGEPMMRKELLYKIIRQYFESEPVNSCNMVYVEQSYKKLPVWFIHAGIVILKISLQIKSQAEIFPLETSVPTAFITDTPL